MTKYACRVLAALRRAKLRLTYPVTGIGNGIVWLFSLGVKRNAFRFRRHIHGQPFATVGALKNQGGADASPVLLLSDRQGAYEHERAMTADLVAPLN